MSTKFSSEPRSIPVVAYRDPNGLPACSVDVTVGAFCAYLASRRRGVVLICKLLDTNLEDAGLGYPRPLEGCPVWAEQAAVQADLAYNALKTSGELRRQEDAHALAEQLKWSD